MDGAAAATAGGAGLRDAGPNDGRVCGADERVYAHGWRGERVQDDGGRWCGDGHEDDARGEGGDVDGGGGRQGDGESEEVDEGVR